MTTLKTVDGLTLEARWDGPADAEISVVFCHPHPAYGGTMTAPLMNGVTDRLVARGLAVLRFNFRGVGDSEGAHEQGNAEIADVDAAVTAASSTHPKVALCGWSFGGAMALRWMAESGRGLAYAGIAPPPAMCPPPEMLPSGPKLIALGDREQVIDADALRDYAARIGAEVAVLEGSDHFFVFRHRQVGDLIADFLTSAEA